MCDDVTEKSNEDYLKANSPELSRRTFAALGAMTFAGACATGPDVAADPSIVTENEVKITTPDGVCDAHFVHPTQGRHAAVLVWPDIMGLRPAFRTMGKRLAQSGYAVLTINPFYRVAPGAPMKEGETFQDPPTRTRLMGLARQLTAETNKTDVIAFTKWLDAQKAVDTRKGIGTTGYCMGGPLVFRSAAYVPERIKAAATYHGGGIATTQPNSPHLLIPQMKASFLVAIAQNDDATDPESKNRLRAAFDAAKLPAEIEVYPAQHGWCAIDSNVYNKDQAEKAWGRTLELFKTALA